MAGKINLLYYTGAVLYCVRVSVYFYNTQTQTHTHTHMCECNTKRETRNGINEKKMKTYWHNNDICFLKKSQKKDVII